MTDTDILDIPLDQLNDQAFDNLQSDLMDTRGIREGTVVKGTVTRLTDDWVVLDIGWKAEGYVAKDELYNGEGELSVDVGDTLDVYLPRMKEDDPALILSKERADLMKAWDDISKAVEADETVSGTIIARVKGGLSVDIGVKAFLPGSQVDLRPVKNLERYIGEELSFKIIKFNKKRGNIVLSRRVLLESERAEKREETLKSLTEGSILTGVVKNITDYGAFVDLGGIDGLLHITDMSYGRLAHPGEMFEVGQSVEIKVLKYDADAQRVSLGYKQIRPDPWDEAEFRYPVGAIVRGKVVSITDYGCFVELEDGIEGLVHISEMTWNKRIKHPGKLVEVGDVVEAKVLDMNAEDRRISLGMKQLESNPWDVVEQQYPVGSVVKGSVRNITEFGIFIGIDEGIDGLVHISDLSWGQRVGHPADAFEKGQEVEARVLSIDKENERFSLGIKQLSEDPWFTVNSRYYLTQVIEGPVVHATDFGVFIELEDGIEGLVHMSELVSEGDDWQAQYPAGKKIKAEITHINSADRRISLSEKAAVDRDADDPTERPPAASDAGSRLGDVFGDLGRKLAAASGSEAEAAPADEPEAAPAEEAAGEE